MMKFALKKENLLWFIKGVLNSYSQIFFSENYLFGVLLLMVTFINPFVGISGITAVIATNLIAYSIGYDRKFIGKGIYAFNSLLVALGLGIFFENTFPLYVIVILSSFLSLLISLSLQGILGKYYLPFLSLPFIITIWLVILATRSFEALALNEKGIFALNELYKVGGKFLVNLFETSRNISLPLFFKAYFSSLGAIFFQFHIVAGIIIAIGLLWFSRISFTLSLLGFTSAWLFYRFLGIDMSIFLNNYVGFNYILTAIAIGAYFFIPSPASYFWAILLTPLVALITISFYNILSFFQLPVYSLPFNLIVLLFLYAFKLRIYPSGRLNEVYFQLHSPEENLYNNLVSKNRFRHFNQIPFILPFWGEWKVSQGYDGNYTHKEEYRHALDFVITGTDGRQFKNDGNELGDYHCYGKAVIAPADGVITDTAEGIPDNEVGKENLKNNWGNSIVIKHAENLYSKVSHLKEKSIKVKKGDHVKAGEVIAACGNSGRSPYPHLHFQVQATPYIGSKTIAMPLGHYLVLKKDNLCIKSFEIPNENEIVSNLPVSNLMQKAFEFTTGQRIEPEIIIGNRTYKAKWEVSTNIYNQTYLFEPETNSYAYYTNDGIRFRFSHFEGNKKSLLYLAYLALYEVFLSSVKDVDILSEFPAHMVFSKKTLFLHDLIAPFKSLYKAVYHLYYTFDNNVFSNDSIKLISEVTTQIFFKKEKYFSFTFEITTNGIEKITVKKPK